MNLTRTFVRHVTLLVAIAAVLVGAPFDKKKRHTEVPPSPPPVIPDQILPVADGRFVFRSMRFVQEYSIVYLAGAVTNETSHNWEGVTFELQWTDSAGAKGSFGTVFCLEFPIHGQCPLGIGSISPGMMIMESLGPQRPYTAQFVLGHGYYIPTYSFSLQKPKSSDALMFEDSNIAFVGKVTRQGIALAILNKTDQPIKIDWNQVSYIDQTGKASGVSHEGVKYADAANSKPPTIIPPTARHEDTIMPVGNIRYADGWKIDPLLPMGADSHEVVGKTIALFMPMEISGKIQNYTITIKIESAN